MTNEALIEAVRTLERQAEHLEQEAALLRQELARFREAIESTIVGATTDGATIKAEYEAAISD